MTLALRYAVRSDVGLLREGNEDSAYAGPHLLAIADGMGGHAAGEVASAVAISALAGPQPRRNRRSDAKQVIEQEEKPGAHEDQDSHLHCRLFVDLGNQVGSCDVNCNSRRQRQSRAHVMAKQSHGRELRREWDPPRTADVDRMALPPCHCLFQFYVGGGKLSCQLYQRSADVFLGVPFNIASYALLTMMVAQVTGLKPGDFVHSLGDAHLYSNHLEQARLQLTRPTRPLPVMKINPAVKDIFAFRYEDFVLEGYDPHPHIKAQVAV